MSSRLSRGRPGARPAASRRARADAVGSDERCRTLELKLREAEERFLDLLEVSSDWIWETDAELRFTNFVGRLPEVSGVRPEALIGRKREDIMEQSLNPEDRRRHFDDLRARRPFKDFAYQVKTPLGLRYFKVSGKPRYDHRGQFLGYRGVGTDITDEVEANRRAQLAHQRFIEAIEHIPASLMLHDAEDRLVLCNTITRKFFPGLDHLLVPGTKFEDLLIAQAASGFIPLAIGRNEAWVKERLEMHRNPRHGTITRQYSDGTWAQIIERKTSDGGIIGIRVDVTELKRQEEALARQTELLQATLDNISQGLSVFDAEGRLVAFNAQYVDLLGLPRELVFMGQSFEEICRYNALHGEYGPGDPEDYVADRMALVSRPEPHMLERHRPNGTIIEIRGNPMPAGGFVTTYTDITERKRVQHTLEANAKRLEEYASELQKSNTDLEQFAYVASHDLQEPLRMVGSYCQLLQRRYQGKLDKDADEFIGFAVEGATRMQRMINDLLTYSRVGRTGKGPAPVSCADIVETAAANLRAAIVESGAKIICGDLPTIIGERTQLLQLFQNLIGNAIKFRSERPVEVDISARAEGAHWHFSVRDNGIGIEAQYADRIFLIFQRLHDRSKYQGTGIGLAVCKKVVEHHGGKIWVEAEPEKGTTFHFTLSSAPQMGEGAS